MNELKSALDELSAGAPIDRSSWQDVVARSRGPRQKRLALAGLAAATFALLASPAFGLESRVLDLFQGKPVPPEQLSKDQLHVLGAMAAGVQPRTPASAQENLGRVGAAQLRLIATRDGRSYYAANLAGGGLCVTVTWPGDSNPFIGYMCSHKFPSPEQPVADRSALGGSPSGPIVRRLEGFAADGVASIEVIAVDGSRVKTPVEDNVYLRTDGLPNAAVQKIVALDSSGRELATILQAAPQH